MMGTLDEMEEAFRTVKVSAAKAASGDEAAKERAFEEIFALNNVIGRLGRKTPKAMPKMKELQGYVNLITVGLKYGRASDVHQGLSVTERSIDALRKDLASIP